jgi:hypothetical protein
MHDSGLVTANQVNASSPGAGIAHFAGSTQTVTSSAVVDADVSFTAPAIAGATATTQAVDNNSTKVATTAYVDRMKTRALGFVFGDTATGSTLTTSEIGYVTVPFACTITGWHIMADGTSPTTTIDILRVATGGTALPTVSIVTGGGGADPALSIGNLINSTTLTNWTSTAIAANDTLGFKITAVTVAKQITVQLDCAQ